MVECVLPKDEMRVRFPLPAPRLTNTSHHTCHTGGMSKPPSYTQYLVPLVTFSTGASVMIFEITAARMLAPYVGTSSLIWTSIIGIVLASLSLGNWLGGRLADTKQDIGILSLILASAALLTGVLAIFKDVLLSLIVHTATGSTQVQGLIASLILLAPISTILGLASPYATRLRLTDISSSGRVVGLFSAIGSIGSIVGTFAAGFWLLPSFGTNAVLIIIGVFLFALSLLVGGFRYYSTKILACLVLITTVPVLAQINQVYAQAKIHDYDTQYSRVLVEENGVFNGRKTVLMRLNQQYSSGMDPVTGETTFTYAQYYKLDDYYTKDVQKALLIGGAGYTVSTSFLKRNATGEVTIVEIDPALQGIAKRFFRLPDSPRQRFVSEDGRTFLNRNKEKYDVIYTDAFGDRYSIPFQLTTLECTQKVADSLSDDGVVITNVIGALTGKGSQFPAALIATYRQVFPFVRIYMTDQGRQPGVLQNIMVVAKKQEFTEHRQATPAEQMLLLSEYTGPLTDMPVLTDNKAPVEQYVLPLL